MKDEKTGEKQANVTSDVSTEVNCRQEDDFAEELHRLLTRDEENLPGYILIVKSVSGLSVRTNLTDPVDVSEMLERASRYVLREPPESIKMAVPS